MSNRKASLYAVLLIALTACTKQDITPTTVVTEADPVNDQIRRHHHNPADTVTIFGLLEEKATTDQTKADMNEAGITLIRIPIFLSKSTVNKTIDDYLDSGYSVQINANWDNGKSGKRDFPTTKDTAFLRSQADAFFSYYTKYKANIPFVVIENEWDYEVQHGENLQDYLTELSIVTAIGHKYGFKIADGGITSGTLQRWTYSQLTGTAQQQWANNYYIGLNNDYDSLMNIVNTYIATAKNINFDCSNVHWYNTMKCCDGFATATQTFMNACNKKLVACNEFGIKANSLNLYDATVSEIKGNAKYAVAYSGSNDKGKAIKLTAAMLDLLH